MNIVKAIALLEKCLSDGIIFKSDNLTAGCDGVVRVSKRGCPTKYIELGELGKLCKVVKTPRVNTFRSARIGRTEESFKREDAK